ncbi:DNA (cytosine-5-)-methyltransferase [Pirellulales bacterium]|nr:DNA (cytosine-5-)-methyltransferase [Pirellulales bacterium]
MNRTSVLDLDRAKSAVGLTKNGELRAASENGYSLFEKEIAREREKEIDSFLFSFIDLFAGIGGFRLGLEKVGGICRFTSERDKFCQQTYRKWFGEEPFGDINDIDEQDIPDHDVLAAGFPCQPFSLAGVSKKQSLGMAHGFECQRQGNLFFRICEIASAKNTPILLLENVKNLKSHDGKKTWAIIQSELHSLGYSVFHQIIDACHWVPQHRERIFIVCLKKDLFGHNPPFFFPDIPGGRKPRLSNILEPDPDEKYTLTKHLWNYLKNYKKKHELKGNGFGYGLNEDFSGITRTLSARYHKDGSEILISRGKRKNPRRLTIVEAARLMGYGELVADRSDVPVSDTQAYRQFGNAVVPAVVATLARQLLPLIKDKWEEQSGGCILRK